MPASASTVLRAGDARAIGAGELLSVPAEPYALDQLDSDSFQQADERRDILSALEGLSQLGLSQLKELIVAFAEGPG